MSRCMSRSYKTCTCKTITAWDDISIEINGFHSEILISHPWSYNNKGMVELAEMIVDYSVNHYDSILSAIYNDNDDVKNRYGICIRNYIYKLKNNNAINEYTLENCIRDSHIRIFFRDLYHSHSFNFEFFYLQTDWNIKRREVINEMTHVLIRGFKKIETLDVEECFDMMSSLNV